VFPRRAKQLVLKGQAQWLEEGHTLQLIHDAAIVSATIPEEETKMTTITDDDTTCPPNERSTKKNEAIPITEAAMLPLTETDSLILYKAQQNVKAKKRLYHHFIAFVLAWVLLGMFYGGVIERTVHPSWRRVTQNINLIEEHIPASAPWGVTNALNNIEWYFTSRYTPPIWHVLMGIMLAWGGWIVYQSINGATAKRRSSRKKSKPDPVLQEYNRLKGIE